MINKKIYCKHTNYLLVAQFFLLFLLHFPLTSAAYELDVFGTISTQLESVSPDTKKDQDYTSFRDVFTRVAFKFGHDFGQGANAFALIELPFDTVNLELNNSYDRHRKVFDSTERLAYFQFNSPEYGSVWVGRGWEPYYSSVAAPVDRFNSFYRGFATYSVLRVDQAAVYLSPDFDGLSFSLMYSHKNGNKKSNGEYDNRNQLTVSYTFDETKLGFGYTETGGIQNQKLYGVSLSKKIQNFYVGAKYERQRSNISNKNVFGHNGDEAINLFAEYSSGLHVFKSHIANVDNFGGNVFHLGYEYKYAENVKLFAEYYQEQTGAAVTRERNGYRDTYWREGGQVLLVGFSFDFSKKIF